MMWAALAAFIAIVVIGKIVRHLILDADVRARNVLPAPSGKLSLLYYCFVTDMV